MSNEVSTMVKKVNIIAPIPIRTVNPPIYGRKDGVSMTPANILKCLIARATVYEVLSDGSTIRLNNSNYNKVNKPVENFVRNKPAEVEKKPTSAIDKTAIKKSIVISNKEDMNEDEEDPELVELAAEIAKLEAEEKTFKHK